MVHECGERCAHRVYILGPSIMSNSAQSHLPHGHDHDAHGHAGHGHAHHHGAAAAGSADEWRIGWAFVIIFVFMLVEVAGGLISGSLALLADAGHMVSDAVALAMSWAALRIGKRP